MVAPIYSIPYMLFASAVVNAQFPNRVVNIPASVGTGDASVQYESTPFTNIDLPKVSNWNSTVYDWWYFDAVSPSSNASITIVFYTSGVGFAATANATTYLPVNVEGTYPDGTIISPPLYSAPNSTVWTEVGDKGAKGQWGGQTAAFYSTDDLSETTVVLNSPEMGLAGTVIFKANAPPHYPCGLYGAPPTKRNDLELLPGVGWVNAHPDADVTVQLNITSANYTEQPLQLSFNDGVGYHDKNWGSIPFFDAVESWYWGHGRIGDYSVVWFDALSSDNIEYHSGFVAKDGKILANGCQNTSVVARPYGASSSSTYPPNANSTQPEGYQLTFDLPDSNVPLLVDVPNDVQLVKSPGYNRWRSNNLTAKIGGKSLGSGSGQWEEFNIPAAKAAAAAAATAA